MINDGALAEQFIEQPLLYSDSYYDLPILYYWLCKGKSAEAEIDYLLTCGQQVVPIEIQVGITGALKSSHQFLNAKPCHFDLRFNADIPSLWRDRKKLTDGSSIDYKLLSLPLYAVGQVQRLIRDCLNEK